MLQRFAIGGLAIRLMQRRLDAVAQAVERRLEIVRDIVGDLAQSRHQLLDPRQHEVEALRQAVELVARAVHRQPPGEIAFHDGARGGGDRIDPGEQVAADQIAAADAEQRHHAKSPQHGRADHARELAPVLDVAADDETVAAGQPEHIGKGEPRFDAAFRRPAIFEFDRSETVEKFLGDAGEIARDAAPGGVGDEIEAVARRLAAVGHGAHELGQSAVGILLGKTFDLGVDGIVQLPGQQHGGVPIDVENGHDRRRAEQRKIGQRQTKGRGAEKLSERCHGWCSRRRGRCAAAASQSSCRSSSEAARHERR